jgi:hypothetical protein
MLDEFGSIWTVLGVPGRRSKAQGLDRPRISTLSRQTQEFPYGRFQIVTFE